MSIEQTIRARRSRVLPGDRPKPPLGWQAVVAFDNRWGRQFQEMRVPQCHFCGAQNRVPGQSLRSGDCLRALCLACGSPQCATHLGCLVCTVGYVGQSPYGHDKCGYKDCGKPAVTEAPRVGQCCREHLAKASRRLNGRAIMLADEIAAHVRQAERGGLDWQRLVWFGRPKYFAVRRWHDDGRTGWTTGAVAPAFETAGQAIALWEGRAQGRALAARVR